MVIGAITALVHGAWWRSSQNDIKRVVAYSTLSQLGYMTVALGASAYSAAIFHLMTHAFFKAVLFLGAGSVIIAMHHEQDMRKMGGLRKYMPITYWTMLIGALANAGMPPFAGFFSKDTIIEAVHLSPLPGAGFAYCCVLAGVFVDGVLFLPPDLLRLPRRGALREPDATTSDTDDDRDHHAVHAPHETPVGGDGAADPARDPVGADRLAGRSSRCSSAATSATPSQVARTCVWRRWPRNSTVLWR